MQPSSDFEMKKIGFFVKKFSSGFVQQESALREKSFAEKWFLFRKSFYFSATIFGVWVIPLSFLQISLAKCVKPPINVWRKKNWGKYPSKNLFFFKIYSGFWAEKTWTFSKTEGKILETVAYRCRRTFSENFPNGKVFVWKFSVIERKHRISGENVFSELSKAHFKSPVQHFERKLIKINFTFCGLGLCVFSSAMRGKLVRNVKSTN